MKQVFHLYCPSTRGLNLGVSSEGKKKTWDEATNDWVMKLYPFVKRVIVFAPAVDCGMVSGQEEATEGCMAKVELEWSQDEEGGEIEYGDGFFALLGVLMHDYYITHKVRLVWRKGNETWCKRCFACKRIRKSRRS